MSRPHRSRCAVALTAVALLAVAGLAFAEWSHDPAENNLVCGEAGPQEQPLAVACTDGSVVIAWTDARGSDRDVYAQRLDSNGLPLWAAGGIRISDGSADDFVAGIVDDGAGGSIVVWTHYDALYATAYAQRVDPSGIELWGGVGVALGGPPSVDMYDISRDVVTDNEGGAIVAFTRAIAGSTNVRAQRVDADGACLWGDTGIPVCYGPDNESGVTLVDIWTGGAVIVWNDDRVDGLNDVYAQRISASGDTLWAADGIPIAFGPGHQMSPDLIEDGLGGVIVVFEADGDEETWIDIHAQRIDGLGNVLWGDDGVVVCMAQNHQVLPRLVSDGAGGAIMAWRDDRDWDYDVYAQRVDGAGAMMWAADGVPVCTAASSQNGLDLIGDGDGGAIASWGDQRHAGLEHDIFAQRIAPDGTTMWDADGSSVSVQAGNQQACLPVTDGAGGAVIVWQDLRGADDDIYAQRIERHGYLGYPSPTITEIVDCPGDQGGVAIVSWSASYLDEFPNEIITHYSVWRRMPPGAAPCLGIANLAPPEGAAAPEGAEGLLGRSGWSYVGSVAACYWDEYGYDAPTYGDSTAQGTSWTQFRIVAQTDDQWTFWESQPDSGYSVDNLAPGAPLALSAEPVAADIELAWSPSGNHDEDLLTYELHRSDVSGFVPDETTLAGSTVDTVYTDVEPGAGPWYYVVIAEDVHGNESEPSNEASAMPWSDVDESGLPTEFAFRGCQPNPFEASTTITFDLPRPAACRLDVFSATGRRVAKLADDIKPAGRHSIPWHGRDSSGHQLPSGVYFARLEAGERTITQKLVLLR